MANEVEVIVKATDKTSQGFGNATKASKDYGKGLEGVGDRADKSEQKVLGLKDTVDGVATIMQGPGKQGIASYLQGWADLASGIANFVIPAVMAFSISNVRAAASTVWSKTTMIAAAAASKAWAAAQWVLNAALSANPIGLVIVGVGLLVAALVLAYKKSETFRQVIGALAEFGKKAFRELANAVLTMIGVLINGAAKAFGWIPGIGPKLKGAAKWFNEFRDSVNRSLDGIKDETVNVYVRTVGGYSINANSANVREGRVSIAGRASGGVAGGLTWVGERGPELVRLPQGSTVYPSGQSQGMASGGGGVARVELSWAGGNAGDEFMNWLRKNIRVTSGGNVQSALGS